MFPVIRNWRPDEGLTATRAAHNVFDGRLCLSRGPYAARDVARSGPPDPDRPRRVRALGAGPAAALPGRQPQGHPAAPGHPPGADPRPELSRPQPNRAWPVPGRAPGTGEAG